ncbi:MAG: OmpA/MotB family protein [Planctomycetota bacterium]
MSRLAKFCVLAVVATTSACVSPEAHRQVVSANDALRKQIADLQRVNDEQDGELRRLTAQSAALTKRVHDAAWIQEQKEKLARLLKELGPGGSEPVPGVKVITTREGTALQVKGEVLFASGKADLTNQGRQTLKKLVPHLRNNAIRADGHTDTDQIKHSKWRTNLNLSAGRAVTVAEFLIDNGLDPKRVSMAGYGEHRPAVEGNDDATKAQNRRVEILLLKK